MISDRESNEVVEDIFGLIIYFLLLLGMIVALPFFAAYCYIRLGINKLFERMFKFWSPNRREY